jgi:hypothetical protein
MCDFASGILLDVMNLDDKLKHVGHCRVLMESLREG